MSKKKIKDTKLRYSGPVFQTFTWAMFGLMLLYTLSLLLLLYFGVLTSLKSQFDFSIGNNGLGNVIGFPDLSAFGAKDALLFGNYGTILFGEGDEVFKVVFDVPSYFKGTTLVYGKTNASATIGEMLWNSVLYVVGGAFFLTIGRMIMGYMCAMYKNPVSKFIYGMAVVTMIIPIVGTTPAMLTLMRNIGLYDTFIGNYIQKFSYEGMYYLIFFEFFCSMPLSYKEAAEIDGASQFRVMFSIYFPLAMKMFGTIFLINAITLWNDYNTVLLYLPSHPTLAYGVYLATGRGGTDRTPRTQSISAAMLLAIPTMVIFFIFKDKLMGNLSMGGLKE